MKPISNEKELIDFVCDLAKREAECIGFVPRIAYEEAIKRGRMIFSTENDYICGFAFWGKAQKPMNDCISIYQMAIVSDCRRVHHGQELLKAIAREPDALNRKYFRLHCRMGLDSNQFWEAVGLTKVATLRHRGQRGWITNLYMGAMRPSPELFNLQLLLRDHLDRVTGGKYDPIGQNGHQIF